MTDEKCWCVGNPTVSHRRGVEGCKYATRTEGDSASDARIEAVRNEISAIEAAFAEWEAQPNLYSSGFAARFLREALNKARTLETPSDDNPDGGHHLVIELGDCEFYGRCMCGERFGSLRPDQSLNEFGYPWERHVMGLGAVQ